jgi:hypothetical protein
MSNVGGPRTSGMSTAALIFEAQSLSKKLELEVKQDQGVERNSKFDKAIEARKKSADARMQKGNKDASASFWRTVGIVAAAVAVVVASVVTFGGAAAAALAAIGITGAMATAVAGGVAALAGALVMGGFEIFGSQKLTKDGHKLEHAANQEDISATKLQKESDDARDKQQEANDRFRAMIDDAKSMDQVMLRAWQKSLE